jgi:arylsulfatase A-like enzyme
VRSLREQGLGRAAVLALAVGGAWVLLEWLFFLTKPSFLNLYPPLEKFLVLPGTAALVATALLLLALPGIVLGGLLLWLGTPRRVAFVVALVPTALLLATVLLVAVDNFTLTLFGWGIRDSKDMWIWVYRLVSLLLLAWAAYALYRACGKARSARRSVRLGWGVVALCLASLPLVLLLQPAGKGGQQATESGLEQLPNIVILSGDGLSAAHMSLYGYERKTTPFLDQIAPELLVVENHFTNASDTGGSIIALLTGKLPTSTQVVYPPDALRGADSFQHLPGLLSSLGYYTADISMRHYADPYDLNLRNGFAEANFRVLGQSGGTLVSALRSIPALAPVSMLLDRMVERAAERLRHIWKHEPMRNPLAEVNELDHKWVRDRRRLAEIRRFIGAAPQPFFLNVHLMAAHGERFKPRKRTWSTEASYEERWNMDGYDDAIADFDQYVADVYRLLKAAGALDSTLLVVNSDHGLKHNALERLPLVFRFPGQQRTGRLGGFSQRIDIAPTLVDWLQIKPLPWMEGVSLLADDFATQPPRTLYSTRGRKGKSKNGNFLSIDNPVPPWYSMGWLSMVHCDQAYILELESMTVKRRPVALTGMDCSGGLSENVAREMLLQHLHEQGYRW